MRTTCTLHTRTMRVHTACTLRVCARTSVNSSVQSATSGVSESFLSASGAGTGILIVHWRLGAFWPGLTRAMLISRAYSASVN